MDQDHSGGEWTQTQIYPTLEPFSSWLLLTYSFHSFTQVSLLRFLLPMLGRDQLGKINKSEFLCE